MKKFALLYFLFAACSPEDLSRKATEEIMATDKAMSKTASEIGFNHALLHYSGDGFVKFNNNAYPIIGKLAFAEKIMAKKEITSLTWEPVEAEASSSGDLGFSWGNWKYVTPDTTYYGNYFSAWKKIKSGAWALVLDGGNDTPQPK
ncbi:MAG TPA: hypothetical protein VNZ49_07970 [Bacteroidia bacterium]|jgi:hypothetical protein|nr:hypothetical protein [Bacteroidia bacterium]